MLTLVYNNLRHYRTDMLCVPLFFTPHTGQDCQSWNEFHPLYETGNVKCATYSVLPETGFTTYRSITPMTLLHAFWVLYE